MAKQPKVQPPLNNVKNIKDAAAAKADGGTQETPNYKHGLKITLKAAERAEAIAQMKARGMEIPENFEGPDFRFIAGYQVNADWVAVTLEVDNTSYIYPSASVARVKHYIIK